MTKRDDATLRQIMAANPSRSTWLSANAGSGKTRVLTDRVARLLLEGVSPQHILCLTYTKAAASEMQNRLFQRLGRWTMLSDDLLREELTELGVGGDFDPTQLTDARTLFARAVETPGGLKIQTIHSFCASLLRRFPLEAGVSPQFVEIEDRTATLLRSEVIEELAQRPGENSFDGIATYYTGDDILKFAQSILSEKMNLGDATQAAVWSAFDLAEGLCMADLTAEVFSPSDNETVTSLVHFLAKKSGNDGKAATKLAPLVGREFTLCDLVILEDIFLFKSGDKAFLAKIGSFPTKPSREALSSLIPALDDLMQRVEDGRDQRLRLAAAQKTWALHAFSTDFLPAYEARKLARGLLDFDDLILKARQLLTEPSVAEWVLFRLDGGIDHILVDEAQDTSPVQWDVIRLLAREFTAGRGARDGVSRTIFVVGDKKQSIYSFQGADPQAFDEMRDMFNTGLSDIDQELQVLTLDHSFRSSWAILGTVDAVFEGPLAASIGQNPHHIAFNASMPGRVDVWPAIEKIEHKEDRHWADPVDRVAPDHHSKRLARQVAEEIQRMIAEERIPTTKPNGETLRHRVRAGDFLILVQRRSELFHEIIRACKALELPIAGADRMKVAAEIAVKDITALLSFLATPEDDLSLAVALRSPLFQWSEQELFTLAHYREDRYLWTALRKSGEQYPQTMAVLDELRRMSDFLRPFDLIERILTRFSGRSHLLARLGPEAEEGIDALLSQALSFEKSSVPSLTGFLTWLAADDLDIKRQMESAGDKIRVMTVHGSKGLEAPIVILPDTAKRRAPTAPDLIGKNPVLWSTAKQQTPRNISEMKEAHQAKQTAERMRLLYVAMTRAESWLITCAAGDVGKVGESWYQLISEGVRAVGGVSIETEHGQCLRYEPLAWGKGQEFDVERQIKPEVAVPTFATHRAPDIKRPASSLPPSGLGGAKALAAEVDVSEDALRKGRIIHLFLEHLYGHSDPELKARALMTKSGDGASDQLFSSCLQEALTVLNSPHLAAIFADHALAEVDVSATLPDLAGQRIHGTIDRLIVNDTQVLAVDFKSNQAVPTSTSDVPEGLLRQMGAYAAALEQIFPDHDVSTAILWTRTAQLMPLSHQAVNGALQRAMSG